MERIRREELEETFIRQLPMIAVMIAEDDDDVGDMAVKAMDLIQACLQVAEAYYK